MNLGAKLSLIGLISTFLLTFYALFDGYVLCYKAPEKAIFSCDHAKKLTLKHL